MAGLEAISFAAANVVGFTGSSNRILTESVPAVSMYTTAGVPFSSMALGNTPSELIDVLFYKTAPETASTTLARTPP